MLNNITIGRYYHKNSIIHAMNPFVKVLCTLIYVLIVVLFRDLFFLFLLLLFVMLLGLMSKIPIKIFLKALWSLKFFVISIIIANLLIGSELLQIVFQVVRILLIVFYSSLLTLTTSPNQLAKGIEILLKPLLIFKVPVKNISLSIVHAIRFIPIVLDNLNSVLKAQKSRSVNIPQTYKEKLKNVFQIIVPTFTKSFDKAATISISMEQRLYNLNSSRTYYEMPKVKFFDLYILTVHLIIFIGILYNLVRLWEY